MKNKLPKGYELGQYQKFTPEMMELWKSLFGQLGPDSYLGRLAGGDQSQFEELEAPALRQFGALQGGLASRFSGMGLGGQKSSGFKNTMNQASSDFAQALQGQRMGLRNQAIRDLMGMSNQLLGQNPYEQGLYKKEKPWWQEFLGSIGGGAGEAFGGGATEKLLKLIGLGR
jgi:hypothetical protein